MSKVLKLDSNFYVLSRGEQLAKLIEYKLRLSGNEYEKPNEDLVASGKHPEAPAENFVAELLPVVARHYDWNPPTEQPRQNYLYNAAVLDIMKTLLAHPCQDVDMNAARFLNLVEDQTQDGKVRRLALAGLRVLTDPDLPFQVSHSTALDVADTLAHVVIAGTPDHVFGDACTVTMARLLEQNRVPFTQSFRAVAALPQYKDKPIFGTPEYKLH